MNPSIEEILAGLLVVGFYYSFLNDELGATTCWKAGVALLPKIAVPNPKKMEWLQ